GRGKSSAPPSADFYPIFTTGHSRRLRWQSDGSQGFRGRELCRADCWEKSCDGANQNRGSKSAAPGGGGDDDRPALEVGVDGGGEHAHGGAGGGAEQSEHDGFAEELGADLPLRCAKGTAESDFGAAFEDADQHDVADADGADEK